MRISFVATEAEFDDGEYSLVAGVSRTIGDQIEHAVSFDRLSEVAAEEEPDEDWGINLQYNDQGYSGYDCIARCVLTRDSLRVDLSKQLGALADVRGIDATIEVADSEYQRFLAGMRRVFRDTDLLTIHQ